MGLPLSDAEVMRRAIESRLGDVFTALPGRVETYYPDTQTADIAPTVRRPMPTADEDTVNEDLPVIPNVPICFPRGGGFSVTWPIVKGDHVVIIIMTLAMGQWRKTGETSDPGDVRAHHLGNAVALPMLAPNKGALPEAQAGDDAFTIVGPMIKLGVDPTVFAALADKVDANFQAITDAFAASVPATPAGPDAGEPGLTTIKAALTPLPSVACTQVKIK